jgi:hypothetical protein
MYSGLRADTGGLHDGRRLGLSRTPNAFLQSLGLCGRPALSLGHATSSLMDHLHITAALEHGGGSDGRLSGLAKSECFVVAVQ